MKGKPVTLLLVEDDPAHAEIVRRNFENFRIANDLFHVSDGQSALDFIFNRGEYANTEQTPRPDIVLLDLRLPRVDGLEVLRAVKANPDTARIPVVVMTTSAAEADVTRAYDLQANSYVVKPLDFPQFTGLLDTLGYYWLAWNQQPN